MAIYVYQWQIMRPLVNLLWNMQIFKKKWGQLNVKNRPVLLKAGVVLLHDNT